MKLDSLGEFGLISWVKERVWLSPSVVRGPGDDCAVLPFDKGQYLLLTCDMLVEGVDFTKDTDPYLVGRKAVAVSISDIAACGGTPEYALASVALPKGVDAAYAKALAKGLIDTARRYKVSLVGGDISSSAKTVVDVSMAGKVAKRRLVLRSGARDKDRIFVTGTFGGSLKGKHLTFIPRVKEAQYLCGAYRLHSMIDVSDGLCQDLGHILKASGLGGVVYTRQVPLSKDASGTRDALTSGEDFELLFTLDAGQAAKLEKDPHVRARCIGEVSSSLRGVWLQDQAGRRTRMVDAGYRHF